jgi:MFS family permease
MISAALFGLTTFPVYSVAAAHAHDFATSEERIELSAALMFFYAVGAIAAPWLTSLLIDTFGPSALFVFISIGHVALIVFGLSRMRVRDTRPDRTPYVYAPRTSFTIGRLLRRARDR